MIKKFKAVLINEGKYIFVVELKDKPIKIVFENEINDFSPLNAIQKVGVSKKQVDIFLERVLKKQ